MSELKAPHFSCSIPVRWGDMDAFGHVNNASYLRFMEEARFQWIDQNGIATNADTYPVVVTIGCTFHLPVFYPDTLRIDIFAAEPGTSSFMAYYKIYSSTNLGKPTAEGYSKIVWVSTASGKSVPLPMTVKSWFA